MRRRNPAAAVVVAVVSAVSLVAAAGTGAAVADLSMLGMRRACFDYGGVAFGHVGMQMTVAVGKGQIHLAVVQLEGDWGWLGQMDQ